MIKATSTSWICTVCGYVHEGSAPPELCAQCGATADLFESDTAGGDAASTEIDWVCNICGYSAKGVEAPELCPQCGAYQDAFEIQEVAAAVDEAAAKAYLSEWARDTDSCEPKFARIRDLAVTGKSEVAPMRTHKAFPDWETVLFKGAQLFRMPLNDEERVSTKTILGKTAANPLELAMPIYVSHMSFGALSKEAKIALARGSKLAGTAICSGEGGLLPVEREEASKYIYELGTAPFSHKEEAIQQGDAIEIKIGQAAKPGMGGHLPGEKVTQEVAQVRGLAPGEDSISPGRHHGINSPEDLAKAVARVREIAPGKPIGVKFTAGHLEEDLRIALDAGPDFITIDCRGGGTGAAPRYIKDNVCLPPIFAIHRARKYLDSVHSEVSLCITGGFRDSMDIAKALAMGADAIALASASLIAIGCQQYRICHSGKCPVGITTQDPALRARFDVEQSVKRFVRFYEATNRELMTIARINGRNDIHALDASDLISLSNEVSMHTSIEHA